jgi:hypothetical protein
MRHGRDVAGAMLTPAHVDLYCRIKSSPYNHYGYRVDEALIFCQQIERRLEKLDEESRTAIVLQGLGYNQEEIARMDGVSHRTMVRMIGEANKVVFAELIEVLGGPVKMLRRSGCGAGRPRKKAA